MGILAPLRLAKIRIMARPNSLDMPPKSTKKARLGINISTLQYRWGLVKSNARSYWLIYGHATITKSKRAKQATIDQF